jgi:hypothetical protein
VQGIDEIDGLVRTNLAFKFAARDILQIRLQGTVESDLLALGPMSRCGSAIESIE